MYKRQHPAYANILKMKTYRTIAGLIPSIALLFIIVTSHGQPKTVDQGNSQEMATRAWEQAILAKGGREKLRSVENMVLSSQGSFQKGNRKISIHLVDLYVFPNKWWSWNDQRPSEFGLSMKMSDQEMGKSYSLQYKGENFSGLETINRKKGDRGFPGLIDLLPETRWDKVIPLKLTNGNFRGRNVQIVQTQLYEWRIDFYLDAETHLPLYVVSFSGDKSALKTRLLEYVDVAGIQMPSKVVFESSDGEMTYQRSYWFNVAYDQNIFKVPPPFEAGPESWKLK